MRSVDEVLDQIQARLVLEAETEHEILEEIRGHLEDAVALARARGLSEEQALTQAAVAFGIEQTTSDLQITHRGWGTLDGVAVAAWPVIFALALRWLIFAPDGSADAWRLLLTRPSLAVIAAVAIVVPILRFPRRRYALTLWVFFWGLSLVTIAWPAARW